MSDDLRIELEALVDRMLRVVETAPSQTMTQFFAFEIKRLLAATAPSSEGQREPMAENLRYFLEGPVCTTCGQRHRTPCPQLARALQSVADSAAALD